MSVANREVTTLEGLGSAAHPHPIQKAFHESDAAQCGFCTPGMIMAAKAFLDLDPDPTRERVISSIKNLCRCGAYFEIADAILLAARELRAKGSHP